MSSDEWSGARFAAYVEELVGIIGHADRAAPLRAYCTGLLMPAERKSVEPIAAITAPARVAAQHQSLLHFVGQAPWSDRTVLTKVRDLVLPAIEQTGAIEAWIVDDTSFPKKGRHSVGVARQSCGQLGKQDNCQVAVTLSLANGTASLPVAYRLYLPKEWTDDPVRLRQAGVPEAITFQTKPEIALAQIRAAAEAGLPRGVVLMDAGYGNDMHLRTGLTELDLIYIAGVLSNTSVWAQGHRPLPPKPWSGRGRPPTLMRRDSEHQPTSVKALALALGSEAWSEIAWREGSTDWLASRFARVRVQAAHRDYWLNEPRPQEWLLIEWPHGEKEPTKYWLSTLPEDIGFKRMVELAKLRWRIERDYQDLKQDLGLGHYEGRGWRGFHHHASLCIAAYGFLIAERVRIPPSGSATTKLPAIGLPARTRPRGAPNPTGAACAQFHRHDAKETHCSSGAKSRAMSMLRDPYPQPSSPHSFVTQ
jgi:SRSO17 transposase